MSSFIPGSARDPSTVVAVVALLVTSGADLQFPNQNNLAMPRVRACLMSSTTLAGIVRLTKVGLALYKGFPSSGVSRGSSNSRDTATQSSRAVVYKVIILTIMFFRPALLSNL